MPGAIPSKSKVLLSGGELINHYLCMIPNVGTGTRHRNPGTCLWFAGSVGAGLQKAEADSGLYGCGSAFSFGYHLTGNHPTPCP